MKSHFFAILVNKHVVGKPRDVVNKVSRLERKVQPDNDVEMTIDLLGAIEESAVDKDRKRIIS